MYIQFEYLGNVGLDQVRAKILNYPSKHELGKYTRIVRLY